MTKLVTSSEILRNTSYAVSIPDGIDISKKLRMNMLVLGNKAVGISAIQIGLAARVCVVKLNKKVVVMINPEVAICDGAQACDAREKCLSVPGRAFLVTRWNAVSVSYFDENGNLHANEEYFDRNARIIQHEIDHMNGITIADKGIEIKA